MKPWITLASVVAPGGSTMSLVQRDDTFVIRVGTAELMSSRHHASEDALATMGCEGLGAHARVLVGGLGLGYTLRTALDLLPATARVDVAELVPEIVEWNRTVLAPLAKRPLDDPRTRVIVGDVTRVIAESPGAYDAILLDVDNGPHALSAPGNANLYGEPALARAKAALRPGGVFAVWSAGDEQAFRKRLERIGFDVRVRHPRAHGERGMRHVVWLARVGAAERARREDGPERGRGASGRRRPMR